MYLFPHCFTDEAELSHCREFWRRVWCWLLEDAAPPSVWRDYEVPQEQSERVVLASREANRRLAAAVILYPPAAQVPPFVLGFHANPKNGCAAITLFLKMHTRQLDLVAALLHKWVTAPRPTGCGFEAWAAATERDFKSFVNDYSKWHGLPWRSFSSEVA